MKILELHPSSFGAFVDRSFKLEPGLNLFYGQNEAGKSTLITFIEFMLYGTKKENMQKRVYLDEYERYLPWKGTEYRGRALIQTDDDRQLEISRNFLREQESASILDATLGKDITDRFDVDKRGELIFTSQLTGLSRSVFRNTVQISQMALMDGIVNENNELSSSLVRAISGAGQQGGLEKAVSILEKALDSIGRTENTNRIKLIKQEITALEEDISIARERRNKLAAYKERYSSLQEETRKASVVLSANEAAQARDKAETLREELERATGLMDKIDKEGQKADEYQQYADFPLQNEKLVKDCEQKRSRIGTDLDEISELASSQEEEITELQNSFKEINAYRDLSTDDEEKIIDLRSKWQGERAIVDELSIQLKDKSEENEQVQARLSELTELFAGLGEDVEEKLENSEIEEDKLNNEIIALSSDISSGNLKRGPKLAFTVGGAFFSFVSSVAAIVLAYLEQTGAATKGSFWLPGILLSTILLGIAIVSWISGRQLEGELKAARLGLEEKEKKRSSNSRERSTIFSLAGVKNFTELTRLKSEFETLKGAEGSTAVGIQKQQLKRAEESCFELLTEIFRRLAVVESAPAGVSATEKAIAEYIQNIRIAESLQSQYRTKKEQYKETANKKSDMEEEDAVLKRELEDLYRGADVKGIVDYNRSLEGKKIYDLQKKKQEQFRDNLGHLLGDREIGSIEVALKELTEIASKYADQPDEEMFDAGKLAAAQEKKSMILSELNTLNGSIEEMESNQMDPGMLELDMTLLHQELAKIKKRQNALLMASEIVKSSSESLHADLSPVLKSSLENYSQKLTGGKYQTLMSDERFDVTVRAPETGDVVPVSSLSAGARDQLILATRLALVEALNNGGLESLPLIFDDSFVEFDLGRAKSSFELLAEIASRRQILFFTCHQRELELADELFGDKLNLVRMDD